MMVRHNEQQPAHQQQQQRQHRRTRKGRWYCCGLGFYFSLLVVVGIFQFLRLQQYHVVPSKLTSSDPAVTAAMSMAGGSPAATMIGVRSIQSKNSAGAATPETHAKMTSVIDDEQQQHQQRRQGLQLGPIFYNLFFPSPAVEDDMTELSQINDRILLLVKEQMFRRKISSEGPNSTVYITLIGRKDGDDNQNDILRTRILKECQPNCFIKESIQIGTEANTIQAMIDYCRSKSKVITTVTEVVNDVDNHNGSNVVVESDDDILVTYIHDKGSYHDTLSNTISRIHGTKAAIECRQGMISNPKKCNICTGKFNILPQYHASSKYVF